MKNTNQNNKPNSAPENQPQEEIRSRSAEKLPGKVYNPGGGGSRERIPAKGNDLTHEDYLLQRDIAREIDNVFNEGDDTEE